jgi:hypothetical protein
MKQSESSEKHAETIVSFASFSFDERETFQWLCKRKVKDPDDFKVEGREHVPDPGSTRVHRDVVVRYVPTGKARRYCPDYGTSWIVKFSDDLEVHYFTPQDQNAALPRYLVLNE